MVARGTHPNSLANLRPGWDKPGPGNPRPGPKVSPKLHKYATWTIDELKDLWQSPAAGQLAVADAIAITSLIKALDPEWGDKAREFVTERMDGKAIGLEVDVAVGVQVLVREVRTASEPRELG